MTGFSTNFYALSITCLMLAAFPVMGQLTQVATFDPTETDDLCALTFDPNERTIWVFECNSDSIYGFSEDGTLQQVLARPGESPDDVDLFFPGESFMFHNTMVSPRTLFFINGEQAAAEIYAINLNTGEVDDTLFTAFGVSHVVGGGFQAVTKTLFLLQDKVPAVSSSNLIAQVSPVSGIPSDTLNIASLFSVNYGDLEPSPNGNLLVVSSDESRIMELTPEGTLVAYYDLPDGVSGLSGVSVDCDNDAVFVGSTSGSVFHLSGIRCEAVTSVAELPVTDYALHPAQPNPATHQVELRFHLPQPATVRLTIFDQQGRRINTLVAGPTSAGAHVVRWEGETDMARQASPGLYFYQLQVGDWQATRQLLWQPNR